MLRRSKRVVSATRAWATHLRLDQRPSPKGPALWTTPSSSARSTRFRQPVRVGRQAPRSPRAEHQRRPLPPPAASSRSTSPAASKQLIVPAKRRTAAVFTTPSCVAEPPPTNSVQRVGNLNVDYRIIDAYPRTMDLLHVNIHVPLSDVHKPHGDFTL